MHETKAIGELTGQEFRNPRQTIHLSKAELAEISDIPQHKFPEFWLGNISLLVQNASRILEALSMDSNVRAVVKRVKRYLEHHYADVRRVPERQAPKTPRADVPDRDWVGTI